MGLGELVNVHVKDFARQMRSSLELNRSLIVTTKSNFIETMVCIYCSFAGEINPVSENLFSCDFGAPGSNANWLRDISDI